MDHTVIPDLEASNTFTQANTFQGTVTTPKVDGITTMDTDDSAVTVSYVRDVIYNRQVKDSVRVSSQANHDVSTLAPSSTIDGITIAQGDRILLKNQTTASENGIYVINAAAPATRAADLAASSTAGGVAVVVQEGTEGDKWYLCTNDTGSDVVCTNALVFTPVGASPAQLAGNGLVVNGQELDVNVDNSTIEIASDTLQLKDSGITTNKIANDFVTNDKILNDNLTVQTSRGLTGGQNIPLGDTATIGVDHTVVPDLDAFNEFHPDNLFSSTTQSTSQSTGAVVVNGGLGVAGNVFAQSVYMMSGNRLKEDVTVLDGALDVIDQLKGVSFTWNEKMHGLENVKSIGLIAQHVHKVAPLATTRNSHTDYLAVEYTRIIPYLVEAVKHLKRMVDESQPEYGPEPKKQKL